MYFLSAPICDNCTQAPKPNDVLPLIVLTLIYFAFWVWLFLASFINKNIKITAVTILAVILGFLIIYKIRYTCPGNARLIKYVSVDKYNGNALIYQPGINKTYACALFGNVVDSTKTCENSFKPGITTYANFGRVNKDICTSRDLTESGNVFSVMVKNGQRTSECQYSCSAE